MLKRFSGMMALLLALMVPMTACDTATDSRMGSVSILLTDAPGDVAEAWVTITDIYLQGEVGEEDPPQGRVFLLENGEETHELRSLATAFVSLVEDAVVPSGTYGQLRVIISGGCVVATEDAGGGAFASPGFAADEAPAECDSPTGTLQMPSFAQTGAKVLLNGLTVSGDRQIVVLDFNVEQSFGRLAGASGQWVMTPVIHGAEIELTATVTATLALGDEVNLPEDFELGDFSATLTPEEGDPKTSSFTDDNGVFTATFPFLIPDEHGDVVVELVGPKDDQSGEDLLTFTVDPTSPQTVTPIIGETVTINWIIQSADENS